MQFTAPEPCVSVIVPSYNHARFVEKCLRSIMKQSLTPLELIVIDDGSSDDSPRIIERALNDCPFASELLVRPNRGLSATLNEGLRHSRGRYFAYLGSDDLWLPLFLEARAGVLEERTNAVVAYGNAYSIDEEDRIIDCTIDWAGFVDGDVSRMLMSTLAPLSPTVLYRRSAIERYGWNEKKTLEDYELYLRLSADGDFAFDARVLSAWRQHGRNASLNLAMMMTEKLEAQRRVAAHLGFTQGELEGFRSLAGFRSAQEYMRQGEKLKAITLALEHRRGIGSMKEAIRMFIGLAAPSRLIRWKKARTHRRAQERYGALQD
ncbi:MAG: glycosyltransferase [Acidobacteriota bacterium]|nr:glycosyltransferase [Acidobacteriota bacterium]